MRKLLTLLVCSVLLFAQAVVAQSTTVSGKVTDSKDGVPMQGVTVRVKGGGTTTTKADGTFSINSKTTDPTLNSVSSVTLSNL
jgi:iron complex outermembrane receptor protein